MSIIVEGSEQSEKCIFYKTIFSERRALKGNTSSVRTASPPSVDEVLYGWECESYIFIFYGTFRQRMRQCLDFDVAIWI